MRTFDQDELRLLLDTQKAAFRRDGLPSSALRCDRLSRLARMILENEERIVETVSNDFQGRSTTLTRAADILGGAGAAAYTLSQVESWMQPAAFPMPTGQLLPGSKVMMHSRPLGVIGAIIPWNGPFLLSTLAAVGILAAGNRLMLKPSEVAPKSADLLVELFGKYFAADEVTVIVGGPDVSAMFSALPFDHLLYTGSTRVGRHVMRAAAENLTPVTLEMGGKSPVIVGASANDDVLIPRLTYGKLMFGGQVCVTPDYALVPHGCAQDIAKRIVAAADAQFPDAANNPDYTAIINDQHFARLTALVEDARSKGADVLCVDNKAPQSNGRRFPLHVIVNTSDDMNVMREEIFGPILPLVEVDNIEAAISYVSARPHPLSAYYFGEDKAEQARVVSGLQAGGLVINDVMCQIFHEQLPFGGVGESGMGHYRGHAGFKRFSNVYPVLTQTSDDGSLVHQRAPYSAGMTGFLDEAIGQLRSAFVPGVAAPAKNG